jgi:hypothetical protein
MVNLTVTAPFSDTVGLGDSEYNIFASFNNVAVKQNATSGGTVPDAIIPVRVFPSFLDSDPAEPLFSTFYWLGGGTTGDDDMVTTGVSIMDQRKMNATTERPFTSALRVFSSTFSVPT